MRVAAILLIVLGGCGPGEGQIELVAWGEEAAVQGYSDSRTDGWNITLDSFVSALDRFALSDRDQEREVVVLDGPWVIDWTTWPEPAPLDQTPAPAERLRVGFDLVVPSSSDAVIGQVDPDIVARMAERGWAHHVVGSATRDDRTVTFAWGFDNPTRHTECVNGDDRTDGLAVDPSAPRRAQITLHAEHLFWNTLRTEESPIAFSALADADADSDGFISTDELRARSVVEAGFETGGVNLDSVYEFIRYSLARAAHFNGGGLCRVQAL